MPLMNNNELKDGKTAVQPNSTDSLFSVGQIRLAELSVYNWGSFNGLHNAAIDAGGTLVTGDNGAGKSTFIDGLMALLLPANRATFNVAAAQGDRSDRTLLSYMRGSFGSAHDGASTRVKSKREGGVVTALRALYRGDDGSMITLSALFWTTLSSNALSDVKRIYVVARRDLALKEILDSFADGNARSLKQWLRDDPAITCCDDSFADYQELYRKLLYMDNKNAPALLSRALGLKKIDNLTGLIRELVLEPSTVKEDAKKVVEEFADLVAIHNQLLDARAQKDHLLRLPELQQSIEEADKTLASLSKEREGLPTYFGEVCSKLWREKLAEYSAALEAISLKIRQAEQQEGATSIQVEGLHEDYINLGGGRIESLKKELQNATNEFERVTTRSSQYQVLTRKLGIGDQLSEEQFLSNQAMVATKLGDMETETKESQDRFAEVARTLSDLQSRQKQLSLEISEIESRPDSNIDIKYQQLRDRLIESLQLDRDQCMFIGELVDVADIQKDWQGAIERALGGLRTTLAVPEDRFSMVTRWLNSRHTGLHVRLQVVEDSATTDTRNSGRRAEFKSDGFLKKLVWRDHPYKEWLKRHLARFDLHCVASTDILDKTPFSMTQEGLVQMDKGRFEKKDQHKINDRRIWCLGFSNKSRLALLRNDEKAAETDIKETLTQVEEARSNWNSVSDRKKLWESLAEYRWDEINLSYWQAKTVQLKSDLSALEQSGTDLDQAKQRWEDVKKQLEAIRSNKESLIKHEGELTTTLNGAKAKQREAETYAKKGLEDSVRSQLQRRVGEISSEDLEQIAARQNLCAKQIEEDLETLRGRGNRAENSAVGIMSSFRSHEKWQVIAVDWSVDVASLGDYLEHLQQLENEGLPQLVEQFVERLNKHATQSLARIRQRLDSERDDIMERIEIINRVLIRTEFRSGSHLKLGAKREKFPHVQLFDQHIRKVLSQATSDDHEARFKQLEIVVEILAKASATSTSNTLESLRLLDPRYQISFYAEELDAETKEVRDVMESSSGKSGGEKESFAGTIVAASLAYVLTPDGHDRPVYSTVFLDEAFSNTAEAVSRRVLRVFKALHIHVNLITPYKNLNLARESARSLLIAERDQENHDSHLCEVTWEEIDRRLADQKERKARQDLGDFGIEVGRA